MLKDINCNTPVYKKCSLVERILDKQANNVQELNQDSYFLSDVGQVIQNVNQLKNLFPTVDLHYSITANPDSLLLDVFHQCGVGFNVSTGPEIEKLCEIDIDSKNIYYSGFCKMNRHIRTSALQGVNLLSFGTMSEMKRIHKLHPDASLVLRINVNDNQNNSSTIINMMAQDLSQVKEIFTKARETGVNICGLHIDVPSVFMKSALKKVIETIELACTYSFDITTLSLGSPCFSECDYARLQSLSQDISEFHESYPELKIIAEPTQLFTESAVELFCTVVGHRLVVNEDTNETETFYYLNDGLYGSLSNVLYHNYNPEPQVLRRDDDTSSESVSENVVFWGPTCDSMDKICSFPEFIKLKIGDVLTFKNVGSFCGSCATNFNGFEIAKSYCVITSEDMKFLRHPENVILTDGVSEKCYV